MPEPLLRKVDCLRLPVANLDAGLRFYRDGLGQVLIWRTETAAGLRMPDSTAELVIHTEGDPPEIDLKVDNVGDAVEQFCGHGGRLEAGPFEIAIGLCAVVRDPWGNRLILLDTSKGLLRTDEEGNVISR